MDHGGGKLLGMVRNSHIRTLGTVPYVTQRLRSDSRAHNLQHCCGSSLPWRGWSYSATLWDRLERAPGQADADAVLADHRCGVTDDYWFLWVRCPACRTMRSVDLRTLDHHPDAAITSLISALSCRSCPNAPFSELLRLSRLSVTDEWNVERGRAVLGE
jgi:hypothetical protein